MGFFFFFKYSGTTGLASFPAEGSLVFNSNAFSQTNNALSLL